MNVMPSVLVKDGFRLEKVLDDVIGSGGILAAPYRRARDLAETGQTLISVYTEQ